MCDGSRGRRRAGDQAELAADEEAGDGEEEVGGRVAPARGRELCGDVGDGLCGWLVCSMRRVDKTIMMRRKQPTSPAISKLELNRFLHGAKSPKVSQTHAAQSHGREDTQPQARQRGNGGVCPDLFGGALQDVLVLLAQTVGVVRCGFMSDGTRSVVTRA